ncbi:MAG: endonuclease/exonuclease/phosphatase family protein [Prevotella sp.]|nr:endonuclease/exonuclease/phosphatase family protein [Prevotella sp.]
MAIVKSILLNVFTGASVTVTALMVAVAYSDRLHPLDYPLLSCVGMAFPVFLVANLITFMLWLMVKWRRAWIPVVGFILSLPAIRIYIPLHLRSEPPTGSIKILSYNVACYSMKEMVDKPIDDIYDYLKRQNADIVCLQEDVIVKVDSATDLANLYPYNDTIHLTKPPSLTINAVGIHTRYPILRKERIDYESVANGSAAFFLQIDGDTVIIINNHLESTHLSTDDRQRYNDMIRGGVNSDDMPAETKHLIGKLSTSMGKRSKQAEAVHRYVKSHSNYPIILCGDFNDTPISYCRRTIAEGLTDCYVATGRGLGISYNQQGFYFRIDQLMSSYHYKPYNCYVDDEIKASDHYPVIGWLKKQ